MDTMMTFLGFVGWMVGIAIVLALCLLILTWIRK